MAIEGLNTRDGIGLTLFVAPGRQDEAAAFYRAIFGATSPRHWINPRTGEVTGIDISIGRATFTVSAANPKRDADPALPGPCTPAAMGRGSAILQLCVDDVDGAVTRAVERGAILRSEPQDAGWGDRVATIIDPFGHIWALATIQQELGTEEFNARGNIQLVEAA
jgi:uncharacterized glyoxalase superfamily protein PhnB